MMRMRHETQSGRRTDSSVSGKLLLLLRSVLTTLLTVSMAFSGIPSVALAEAVERVLDISDESGNKGENAIEVMPEDEPMVGDTKETDITKHESGDSDISTSNGAEVSLDEVEELESETGYEGQAMLCSGPRKSDNVTTWDCVWFGSYPQTEIKKSDSIYSVLQNATYDTKGDTTIRGTKYRRVSRDDVFSTYWSDGIYYKYFIYEPVKWRVLEVSGSNALVVSDVALDNRGYNTIHTSVTWETSSVRSWLNGYDKSANQPRTDYSVKNFVDSAFSSDERTAINTTVVVNDGYGTLSGKNTNDRVFLLSKSEISGDGGVQHGFAKDDKLDDEARWCVCSNYAYVLGSYTPTTYSNTTPWWLRSPGSTAKDAACVGYTRYGDGEGSVYNYMGVTNTFIAVRPALYVNLLSSWVQPAGTVSSNGSKDELAPSDTGHDDTTTIQPKPLRNYYGAQEYMRSSAMKARDEAVAFVNAMDDYLSVLKVQTEKSAKSISGSNLAANHGKLLEQAVADKGELVAMDANMPSAAKNAAYTALAQYLDTFVASEPFEKKVDMSADSIKVSTQLVNEIRNNLNTTVIDRKIGGYTVHLSALSMWSSGFETITVTGGGHTWYFTSVTNAKDTADLLTAYVEELKKIEKDALYTAMRSIFTELADVTGISDWSKRSIKKALEKRVAQLQQCGFGDLFRYCTGLREGYDIISSIASATDEQSATRALRDATGMADKISKIDLSDSGVRNGIVKTAMKKLQNAKERFYMALFNYLEDPEREEDPGFWANLWEDVTRIFFQCPVDVYVYDTDGNEIGKVEDGVATCTEDISVTVNGDVKEVLIPSGVQARVELIGTGEGSLTCFVEQAVAGRATGRAVWYDMPLSEGMSYTRAVSGEAVTQENCGVIASASGDVAPSVWYSAEDQEAHVNVACGAGEGGTASGGGVYPLGESVELTAYPDDDFHRFAGWYVGDELMCNDSTYRFPARENVEVEARFVPARVVDDAWEGAVAKAYADDCAAVMLKRSDGLDDAAIGMSGMESEIPTSVTLKKYREGSSEPDSSQCEVEVEDGYRATIGGLDLEGVTRVDVLLEDGSPLAAFMPAGSGVERLFLDPYAILYPDGELVIQRGDEVDAGKGEPAQIWELNEDAEIAKSSDVPWYRYSNLYGRERSPKITKVRITDEIRPACTAYWFAGPTIQEIDGLENLDTSRTASMCGMFENSVVEHLDLRGLDTSNVTNMKYMFDAFRGSTIDLSTFDTSNATNMYGMFSHCRALPNLDFSTFDTSKVEDMSYMFEMRDMDEIWGEGNWEFDSVDLSWLDTSSATTMCGMFEAWPCASIDVPGLDVSSIEDATGMFTDCRNLAIVDLSAWKCPNLMGISNMFKNCESLKSVKLPDLSSDSLTWMKETFSGCSSLKAIDVSKVKTSKVVNMAWLFANCSSLERIDLSGFDTSSVNYRWMGENKGCDGATGMLENCASLKEIVVGERFDVSLQDEFPASPVHNDSWWSVAERKWIPTDEIRATRSGIADTYRTAEIVSIGAANVDAIPDQAYTGKSLTPKPQVKIGGQTLTEGTDYTLSYKNNTNVGTATVTVTGRGDYEGSTSVSFKITPASIAGAAVTLAQTSFTYDGRSKEPGVTVRLGSKTLRAGTDYTVGFSNNVNAGTATVIVAGKGNYEGTTSATFKIVPPPVPIPAITPNVSYRTHVQRIGWQKYVVDGAMSGTSGKSYRLEGINVKLTNRTFGGGITYRTHVQRIGWQGWRKDGSMSGTSGKSYRLEAIEVKLYGEMAKRYDVYYRVHCQRFGWMGWAKNGQRSGSAGYSRRLEGIQIVLVPKGKSGPGRAFKGITQRYSVPFMQKGKK